MKRLQQPIFYLQWALIMFSIIALLFAIFEGFKMSFDLSSKGYQTYLKLFTPYSILFAATFVVITAHLAIERLGIMTDANLMAFKASNRTNWMQILREFLNEIKTDDPNMAKDMTKQLLAIHDFLFEHKYKLMSKNDMKAFFNKFFANRIQFYEQMNRRYMNLACYRDRNQSYSWEAFRYIVVVMLEEFYTEFIIDIKELYQKEVIKFSQDKIDEVQYNLNKTYGRIPSHENQESD